MRLSSKTLLALAAIAFATQAAAQITFYEGPGLRGHTFTADGTIPNFANTGFNDRASSAVVENGSWEACEHANFQGRCVVLNPGTYDSLAGMGMDNRISSVRPAAAPAYGYAPPPRNSGVYQADIISVRAIAGPPEQRCWIEREQVVQQGGPNVPGAIIGGVVGGVLGHQIGGGRGRDVATAGGAVAGAAVGANVGRGGQVYDRDVQHCANVPSSSAVQYWDVAYNFQGQEHHVQMSAPPPGPTITVDAQGNPRG